MRKICITIMATKYCCSRSYIVEGKFFLWPVFVDYYKQYSVIFPWKLCVNNQLWGLFALGQLITENEFEYLQSMYRAMFKRLQRAWNCLGSSSTLFGLVNWDNLATQYFQSGFLLLLWLVSLVEALNDVDCPLTMLITKKMALK